MKAVLDNWSGSKSTDIVIHDASAFDCARLLEQMDGHRHTMLLLERSSNEKLVIGGGDNAFIICKSLAGDINLTLINIDGSDEETAEVCAGGQVGEYPTRLICRKDLAQAAIAEFVSEAPSSLAWQSE